MDTTCPQTVYQGRYLHVARRGAWEYATRPNAAGVVAVIALHDDGRLVLVEQFRPPIDASVLELPAGLVGDIDGAESMATAARRELEEETGYVAREWVPLGSACSSPGLTDEAINFVLARGLERTGDGGGVGHESITVHEVGINDLPRYLAECRARGTQTDMKLLAGVSIAMAYLQEEQR